MRRLAATALLALGLTGCATGPSLFTRAHLPSPTPEGVAGQVPHDDAHHDLSTPVVPVSPLGAKAAEQARALVGAPYRYGGRDPGGFDCSGLVWYVYQSLGIELPRRARDQRQGLAMVARADLEPGDLVFFTKPVDHVGIYLGGGEFVHAPSRGKRVSIANLDAPYFQLGYAGAGRVVTP